MSTNKTNKDDLLLVTEVFRFPVKKYYWQMRFFKPKIYLLNFQKKKIIRKINTPEAFFDIEDFKFLRLSYHYSGARGITSNGKYIFVAVQNSITVYDLNLKNIQYRIENKLFNGIHEIVWANDKLYVTCAVTDSIIILSETGEVINEFRIGDNSYFNNKFKTENRTLDNRMDYRLMHKVKRLYHINNVQVKKESVYANFNKQSSFVKVFPDSEIILSDPVLKQTHNTQYTPCGEFILVNDTGNYSLKIYNQDRKFIREIDFRQSSLPINFLKHSGFGQNHDIKAGWLRGLTFSIKEKNVVYVGLSPVIIVAVNYQTGEILDYIQLRKNVWISVHGIYNLSVH